MAAQQAIASRTTPKNAFKREAFPRLHRLALRHGSNPTNGKSTALKSPGAIARSSESPPLPAPVPPMRPLLATVVAVCIASVTFVGPEPAGIVDGVIVA